MSKIFLAVLLAATVVFSANAQANITFPGMTNSSSTVKKELTPVEKLKQKISASRTKNPEEYVDNLAELLNKYPYSWQVEASIYLTGSPIKNLSPEETKNLTARLISKTGQINSTLRALVYSESSAALLAKNLNPEAVEYSGKAAELLNEADWIELQRKVKEQLIADRLKENPNYKPTPFNAESAKKDFVAKKVSVYNTLGKSLWETGNSEAAEKAFRQSFAARETKESALGIARAADKNGKADEALKFGTIAVLTGMLQPEEMKYFYALYAAENQGKTDNIEKYLDAEYAKTYRSPIKNTKYVKSANRSDRTVLAEFFTGAGCHPCVAYDEAFEKIREDYSDKDVSLLVYHADIPINDPMSNYSVKSREKYYTINYAPQVFIDGNSFREGPDEFGMSVPNETEDGRTQRIYDTLNVELKKRLDTPADSELKLKVKRKKQIVSGSVNAGKIKNVSDDATLHVALVENETSYSGENGFRFQIRVVRALAGDGDKRIFGFKVNPSDKNNFNFSFDVDDIIKRNLAYYDTSVAERREEYKTKYAGMENAPFVPDYKYRRPQIDAGHLSVVAFLQDNKTKKILQSVTIDLGK